MSYPTAVQERLKLEQVSEGSRAVSGLKAQYSTLYDRPLLS